MALHIINKTSAASELNDQVCNALSAGDHVLLIEDGVLQCNTFKSSNWYKHAAKVYVLAEDAKARGVNMPEQAVKVDYNGFVQLTIEHDKVISWY